MAGSPGYNGISSAVIFCARRVASARYGQWKPSGGEARFTEAMFDTITGPRNQRAARWALETLQFLKAFLRDFSDKFVVSKLTVSRPKINFGQVLMLTPSFRCNPFAVEAMHVFRNVVETILDGEVPGFKPVHLGFGQFP